MAKKSALSEYLSAPGFPQQAQGCTPAQHSRLCQPVLPSQPEHSSFLESSFPAQTRPLLTAPSHPGWRERANGLQLGGKTRRMAACVSFAWLRAALQTRQVMKIMMNERCKTENTSSCAFIDLPAKALFLTFKIERLF